MSVGSGHVLALSGTLFAIGLGGTLSRRDGLGMLMSLGVLYVAIAVALVGFGRLGSHPAQPHAGFALAFVVMAGATAHGIVGIAVLLLSRRRRGHAVVGPLEHPVGAGD